MTSSSTCLPKRHMADIPLGRPIPARSTASAGFRVMTFEPSWGAITGRQMLVTASGAIDHDDFVSRVESRLAGRRRPRIQTA